jgi:hypothetical protein
MKHIIKVKSKGEFVDFIENFHSPEEDVDFYKPEIDDLYFLYELTRKKVVVSVLEYGSGWSSLALNLALFENRQSFDSTFTNIVRHPNLWSHLIIDADKVFLDKSISRINGRQYLLGATGIQAICEITEESDGSTEVVASWSHLPKLVPDLIYVDGPDDNQIVGSHKTFSYGADFMPPIFNDLIKIEHFLWPETLIVFDGRTAHARYLLDRFHRNWNFWHDPFGDRTIMRLEETPFGEISAKHMSQRLECSKVLNEKEKPVFMRS